MARKLRYHSGSPTNSNKESEQSHELGGKLYSGRARLAYDTRAIIPFAMS